LHNKPINYFILRNNRNKNLNKIIYGRVNRIDVLMVVENAGENAYQSMMEINYHSDLEVNGVDVNQVCTIL